MIDISELFWNASVKELKQGYVYNSDTGEYICLVCGNSYERGVIYSADNVLYAAEKFIEIHIAKEHSSMFEYLLNLDKKLTGLSDHQKNLLHFFHQSYSDAEIVQELGGGSTSTIRNHRFTLREKEKQAKIFLAIMDLLTSKPSDKQEFITIPRTANMIDQRFAITKGENDAILKTFFKEGLNGPLSIFPLKEKKIVAVLKHVVKRFEMNRKYTEQEVNNVLVHVYHDYVKLRRYLIEYGFMERNKAGSSYWVKI